MIGSADVALGWTEAALLIFGVAAGVLSIVVAVRALRRTRILDSALALALAGHAGEALAVLGRLRLKPDSTRWVVSVGLIHLLADQPEKVLDTIESKGAEVEHSLAMRSLQGRAYLMLGHADEACQALQVFRKPDSKGNPITTCHYAEALLMAERLDEAEALLDELDELLKERPPAWRCTLERVSALRTCLSDPQRRTALPLPLIDDHDRKGTTG